jgi:hypothetical protein
MPLVPATSYGRATSVLPTNCPSHSCSATPTSGYSSRMCGSFVLAWRVTRAVAK